MMLGFSARKESMAVRYQAFPGMDDILPAEVAKWQWLEEKARVFFESRNFKEIRTPILEPTELFVRSIGETSDIVHKEMYTFEDRGERSMTMRPEMTASVARSVLEHGLLKTAKSLKLYYIGPMFRAERPQAGRKRQFHQIGLENINNEEGSAADGETISALYDFLVYAGVKPKLRINDLTYLNGPESDTARGALRKYFEGHKEKLDPDSLYRLDKNVLRIFDSKNPDLQEILARTPWDEIAPLSDGFRETTAKLQQEGIACEINRKLVRGLDYYTGMVFEISLEGLGAQDAAAGGGRYDNLYGELGSKTKVPCVGFSIGIERLLMAIENGQSRKPWNDKRPVYFALIHSDQEAARRVRQSALALRERGFTVDSAAGSKMDNHFKKANQTGARWMIIVGEDELRKGSLTVKDMDRREQKEIKETELLSYFEGVVLT